MLFPSTIFLFAFLPALLLLYYVVPGAFRNALLLTASLIFYAWGETVFVGLMLASIVVNHRFGLLIGDSRDRQRSRWLFTALAVNLGSLAWFKYADFLVANLNVLLDLTNVDAVTEPGVHLPLGVSFFTFQAMSYLIDVYRGTTPVQRRLDRVALYISLFPQLIAGPIVRYHDIAAQLEEREHASAQFASGVRRFIVGLAKKMLIANTVGGVADEIFALPGGELSTSLAWLGIGCYALQIYFDFSAYSDMAIGLGRMFGFRFLENFDYPYVARSVTEFWRRWHISLSRWFRDYLYIPLGGNRVAPLRTYRNLATVFLLCGLWHGASWNFVIWGAVHGAVLIIERAGLARILETLPRAFQHAYALVVVLFAWVYFRAESLAQGNDFSGALLGLGAGSDSTARFSMLLTPDVVAAIIAGTVLSGPVFPWLRRRWAATVARVPGPAGAVPAVLETSFFGGLLLVSLAFVAAGTYNPFIYFRF